MFEGRTRRGDEFYADDDELFNGQENGQIQKEDAGMTRLQIEPVVPERARGGQIWGH